MTSRPIGGFNDPWMFYAEYHDYPDVFVPQDNNGYLKTREHWLEIKKRTDAFFDTFSDESIELYNIKLRQRYRDEQDQNNLNTTQVEKEKKTKAKQGYIYILKSEAGHYKIGKAKDPFSRSQTLGTEHAHKINLIYIALCHDYTQVERYLHQALASYRMNGEWFNLPSDKVEWLLYHDWIDDAGLGGNVTSMERIPQ